MNYKVFSYLVALSIVNLALLSGDEKVHVRCEQIKQDASESGEGEQNNLQEEWVDDSLSHVFGRKPATYDLALKLYEEESEDLRSRFDEEERSKDLLFQHKKHLRNFLTFFQENDWRMEMESEFDIKKEAGSIIVADLAQRTAMIEMKLRMFKEAVNNYKICKYILSTLLPLHEFWKQNGISKTHFKDVRMKYVHCSQQMVTLHAKANGTPVMLSVKA